MNSTHQTLAQTILQAHADNTVIAPFSQKNGLTLDDAYAIQKLVCAEWQRQGDQPLGKKVAFANIPSQQRQGLSEPASATIFASGLLDSSRPIPLSTLPGAVIEAEVTFLLKSDLHGADITEAHVLAATEAVFASFEIISCRVEAGSCGLDRIAANICFGGIILGGKVSPANLDLRTMRIILEKNGQIASTATGADVLGSPACSVAWLANNMTKRGERLRKGDLILSGCAPAALAIAPGDSFTAHFEHLGSVRASFC